MAIDPAPYLDPATCAIVSMECQEGLLGPQSVLPGLAKSAADGGLIETLSGLYDAARRVGVHIYYCTDERRPDGFGFADNTLVSRHMAPGETGSGGHGAVMPEIAPRPEDVVFRREQGLTGFFATGLDAYLRNTGVRTVIVTGISLNIAVLGTCLEAMNLGYRIVVPSDGIASDPPEYADIVLRYTIRNIALVVPSRTIIEFWAGAGGGQ